jgi:hypothetical protein
MSQEVVVLDDDEDDLQKAIKLSLEGEKKKRKIIECVDEEDDELSRALALSIQESQETLRTTKKPKNEVEISDVNIKPTFYLNKVEGSNIPQEKNLSILQI